jgi:hypothetical protein
VVGSPDDYDSNLDFVYDEFPDWEDLPFTGMCELCRRGDCELCQASVHAACGCFQSDHMEEFA